MILLQQILFLQSHRNLCIWDVTHLYLLLTGASTTKENQFTSTELIRDTYFKCGQARQNHLYDKWPPKSPSFNSHILQNKKKIYKQ